MRWRASFLFIAEGLRAAARNGVPFLRIALGCAQLPPIPAARRPGLAEVRWRTVVLGIGWLAFPLSMCPYAEQHVSSALTGMLNGATALFVAVVASVLARQLPSRLVTLG